MQMLHF